MAPDKLKLFIEKLRKIPLGRWNIGIGKFGGQCINYCLDVGEFRIELMYILFSHSLNLMIFFKNNYVISYYEPESRKIWIVGHINNDGDSDTLGALFEDIHRDFIYRKREMILEDERKQELLERLTVELDSAAKTGA